MDNTAAVPRSALRNPLTWAAALAPWLGLTLVMYTIGAFRHMDDGRTVSMASWRWWANASQFFGPLTVGTLAALHWVPRLVARPSAGFWRGCVTLVLVLASAHATVSALSNGTANPFVIASMALMFGFNYSAIVGVVAVSTQRRLVAARQRELLAVQLRALRAQLQPHFLFNTLQAIGATAPRDGAAAARMTALLGDLLRQTLQERDGALVTLAEEHELLQPYLQLQQLRFADRLRVEMELPAALLGAKVPDLLLQPLVENALQHGIEQRPGPGTVRMIARRDGTQLVIDVHDDGVGLAAPNQEPPLGTGLGATKARLQALFGDRASLSLRNNDRGGTTASLRLPFAEVVHAD